MGDKTDIGWTDATWNPLRGCSKVSAGCKNCYAEKMAARFCWPGSTYEETQGGQLAPQKPGPYHGLITDDGRWNGEVRLVEHMLDQPLRWKKPRLIFVNSMSDLFHESVPFEQIAAIFGVMAAAPQHTFQCLTKRAGRMLEFFEWTGAYDEFGRDFTDYALEAVPGLTKLEVARGKGYSWPLSNVWMGVSCENQEAADERIPLLLQCPAAVRWVSYEPALGPIDFDPWLPGECARCLGADEGCAVCDGGRISGLDWIVVGGESQHGARPFDLAWARSTVSQCAEAGVACFVKQMGSVPVTRLSGASVAGMTVDMEQGYKFADRAGADTSEWPADLRVREYPGGES